MAVFCLPRKEFLSGSKQITLLFPTRNTGRKRLGKPIALSPMNKSRKLAMYVAAAISKEIKVVANKNAPFNSVKYLKWACDEIVCNADAWEEDKLHRWIGWVQGVSNCLGVTTVEEERNRIRQYKEQLKDD
jgi:hypothetical protein